MSKTTQEIFDDAQKSISDLQKAELQANADINAVKDKEWNGPLSSKDRDQLVELRSAKASILGAIEELAFVTMQALDESDELKRINNAIAGVVKDLKSVSERIDRIGKVAETVGEVLGGVVALSKKIKDFTTA
jgi:hypothetical protein